MNELEPDDINDLKERLRKAEDKNAKLSRLLRSNNKLIETFRVNMATQQHLRLLMVSEKEQQEAYIRLLLEHCPDIIFLLDHELRFVLGTKSIMRVLPVESVARLTGYTISDIFSSHLKEPWGDELIELVEKVLADEAANAGKSEQQRYTISSPRQQYEVFLQPVRKSPDDYPGVLVLLHNVTELMRAKVQAETANQAKTKFLSSMSHEIRTPINAIVGLMDFIGHEPLSDKQREYLSTMESASQSLLSVINDILDFSTIEAGKLELAPAPFLLRDMLEHLVALIKPAAEAKGLAFKLRTAINAPKTVLYDEKRLCQILLNLLSNAVKYTTEGMVDFFVYVAEGRLRFKVTDTGIGIKRESISRMYHPFERLDLALNKNAVGTGLGLPIARELSLVMDGNISLESDYGKGSVFELDLPLVTGVKDIQERQVEKARPFTADASVLVVDDLAMNLMVAGAILKHFGIMPDKVESGEEAIAKAKEKQYDLIFMDHMMPDMDGVETTSQIREKCPLCRDTPIIALTANVLAGTNDMYKKMGFNGYLLKPVNIHIMRKCLLSWLPAGKITFGDA